MKWAPRIRLRTIFVLFFCAAVGLATYPDPLGALEPAIATAMVIGLLQQTRQLWRWRLDANHASGDIARQFAITWRLLLSVVVGSGILLLLLDRNNLLPLSDDQRVAIYSSIVYPTLSICATIVLCNSLARWKSGQQAAVNRPVRSRSLWLVGIGFALLATVRESMTVFLTHWAAAGIHTEIPIPFRRPHVYPDLRDESFMPLWIAAAAVGSLIVGGGILAWWVRRPESERRRWAIQAIGVFLLAIPAAFCGWYYTVEFHRISPDIAGAGLDASWDKWLIGTIVAIVLVSAAAYRLARQSHSSTTLSADLGRDIDMTSLHESGPCLLAIGVHSLYAIGTMVASIASMNAAFGRTSWMGFVSMIWSGAILLVFAQSIAGLQLCWVRWHHRSDVVPWKVAALSRPVFVRGWIAMAIWLVIAIPTLNAFAFVAWLGPIDLLRLFGF